MTRTKITEIEDRMKILFLVSTGRLENWKTARHAQSDVNMKFVFINARDSRDFLLPTARENRFKPAVLDFVANCNLQSQNYFIGAK